VESTDGQELKMLKFTETLGLNPFFWLLLGLASFGHATNYTVDAPGKLTTISGQLASAGVGTHHIRFGSYANVGSVTLTTATADSIIFERNSTDTLVIDVTGSSKFLKIDGLATTTVVLRGLAFRLGADSKLIEGAVLGSPSPRLVIDSCIIMSDSLNSAFISWLGATGSRIDIRRSILVSRRSGPLVKLDLQADTVSLQNNLINFEGVASCKVVAMMSLINNTNSHTQFNISTDGTAKYLFRSNYFATPPSQNRLSVGGASRYPIRTLGDFTAPGASATTNSRDIAWSGFDYPPASTLFTDSSNIIVTQVKADTTLWDWRIASDTQRGAWNGTSPLLAFNLQPNRTVYTTRLGGKDSVEATVLPASTPRLISLDLTTSTYPTYTDSTRTLWRKDSSITLTGIATVTRLIFPQINSAGKPMLYSADNPASAITVGAPGIDGSTSFTNTLTTAKYFLPAFSNQNTKNGLNAQVTGIGTDTSIQFASITRTGRSSFSTSDSFALSKRYRPVLRGSSPFGLRLTTSAEGAGAVLLGLSKSGATVPFISDSLTAYDGTTNRTITDSAGKYWVALPITATNQFRLYERLALGSGRDTVKFSGNQIIAASAKGHQLKIDSSLTVDESQVPTFAAISKPTKLGWIGRAAGDSLYLILKKSVPEQSPFSWTGDSATPLIPFAQDSASITLALNLGDSATPVFLARKYPIAGGSYQRFTLGEDSVKNLISTTPGALSFDTSLDVSSLVSDTVKVYEKRRIQNLNLNITENYNVAVKAAAPLKAANAKGWVKTGVVWASQSVAYAGGYWRLTIPKDAIGFVIGEFVPKPDTTVPIDTTVVLKSIRISPDTVKLSKPGQGEKFVVAFTPSKAIETLVFKSLDTSIVSVSDSGVVLGLKSGIGRIRANAKNHPGIFDTAFVLVVDTLIDTVVHQDTTHHDTVALVPAEPPKVTVVNGAIKVTQVLSDSEAKELDHYTVEVTTVSVDGLINISVSKPLAATETYTTPRVSSGIQTIRITFETKGKVKSTTEVQEVPIETAAIIKELNSKVQIAEENVWSLIGFPRGASIEKDINKKFHGKKLRLRKWNDAWVDVVGDSIRKAEAILIGIDSSFKPEVPESFTWKRGSDTIALKTGWNLITCPLPFAIADARIGLDPKIVSWAQRLSWDTTGKDAQSIWTRVDTLRPMVGYAIYAASPTTLVFDPDQKTNHALPKSNTKGNWMLALKGRTIGLQFLSISEGEADRPTPAMPFLGAGPNAHWGKSFYPTNLEWHSVKNMQENMVIQSLKKGVVTISLDNSAPLYLYDPQSTQTLPLDKAQEVHVVPGQNWYSVVSESALPGFLEKVKRDGTTINIKRIGRELLLFVPLNAGNFTHGTVRVFGLNGHLGRSEILNDLTPGNNNLPIQSNDNRFEILNVRLEGSGTSVNLNTLLPRESK
jgi:hypothetical protein